MKYRLKVFTLIIAAAVFAFGMAEAAVVVPGDTEVIKDMAFYGNTSITEVVLQDSVERIGNLAFGYCSGLVDILVPASVKYIAPNAFEGVAEGFVMWGDDASSAHKYALNNGIPWGSTVTRRALIIGQSDYPSSPLRGTLTDAESMYASLNDMSTLTPFEVINKQLSLTGSQLRAQIRSTFAGAGTNDVSLFYYSGHGGSSGTLCGVDWTEIYPYELRRMLDEVPGVKIVIIDACHSGGVIGRQVAALAGIRLDESAVLSSMTQAWINAFSMKTRGADDLADGGYYVMTAARSSQLSVELSKEDESLSYGLFTSCFLKGCGWDEIDKTRLSTMYADTDGDRFITLNEAFDYTVAEVENKKILFGFLEDEVVQDAQVYPANSGFILFGR